MLPSQLLLTSSSARPTYRLARRQYEIAQQNLRLNLFDRRLKLLQTSHDLARSFYDAKNALEHTKAQILFIQSTATANYLLPPSLQLFLNELTQHSHALQRNANDLDRARRAEDPNASKVAMDAASLLDKRSAVLLGRVSTEFDSVLNFRDA